ncbi:hypothetical protein [Oleiharenicola sp. Vm1]|uniref:hypothetical protein n=1 Tax=Oleiharenicola sp. Vm1 TaxID=3398393 RepID=UPI0039F587CD
MPKSIARSRPSRPAACGCRRCTCVNTPRCRCHVFNALVALALWDLRRATRAVAP